MAQPVVDVAALRPLTRRAEEPRPGKSVTTGLRDEVDARAAHLALTEAARQGQLHFLGVRSVDDVARGAAAIEERRARAQAIDVGASFVPASAMAVEDAHRGHQIDLVAAAGHRSA